ncbi:hypothetical protein [Aeromicrobium sp. P5_D10]
MKALSASPSLHGPHLLVVADESVDIDLLRKLGFTQITIARRRADGSFDPRIDVTFDLAIATITRLDAAIVRTVADFVLPRLAPDAPLQFFGKAKTRVKDLTLIRDTLPRLEVAVAPMPKPFNRQAIEVRTAQAGRWSPRILSRDRGSRSILKVRRL